MSLLGDILIVDDERTVRFAFKALFESEGYGVILAKDGEEAVALFREHRPLLVLMDIMMPRKNGIAACGEIRAIDPLVPILSFTAMPSDIAMVRSLGKGADDYIPKDRPPEEFIARVGAALRKAAAVRNALPCSGDVVKLGSAVVDFAKMNVTVDGETSELTKSERMLLELLLSEKGRCFMFDEIFSALRGDGYIGDDVAIRVLVSRLKQKLGSEGVRIVSVRSHGYKIIN